MSQPWSAYCGGSLPSSSTSTYELATVGSATDAFVVLLREQFDLILLDIVLPVIDYWHVQQAAGLDLLKRVRDLGVTAPVLMMTGGAGGTPREVEAFIEGPSATRPLSLRFSSGNCRSPRSSLRPRAPKRFLPVDLLIADAELAADFAARERRPRPGATPARSARR